MENIPNLFNKKNVVEKKYIISKDITTIIVGYLIETIGAKSIGSARALQALNLTCKSMNALVKSLTVRKIESESPLVIFDTNYKGKYALMDYSLTAKIKSAEILLEDNFDLIKQEWSTLSEFTQKVNMGRHPIRMSFNLYVFFFIAIKGVRNESHLYQCTWQNIACDQKYKSVDFYAYNIEDLYKNKRCVIKFKHEEFFQEAKQADCNFDNLQKLVRFMVYLADQTEDPLHLKSELEQMCQKIKDYLSSL